MCLNLFDVRVASTYRSTDKMYGWKRVSGKCLISKGYIGQFGNQGNTQGCSEKRVKVAAV